jgi:hypothetical protein
LELKEFASASLHKLLSTRFALRIRFPDFDQTTLEVLARVLPFTMTSPARVAAVCAAARYVDANQIPGAFVECGVWKGGSSMAAALSFSGRRDMYLFDTYEGMTAPTEHDLQARSGASAADLLKRATKDQTVWCRSPLDEVRRNMESTGYPSSHVNYVKGRVEDTIPDGAPDAIALLRLDTDWYESTRHELVHLYPRLSPGGVIIIDDYGYWAGAKKAVDEYLGTSVLLSRIDETGRIAVKPSG